MLCMHCEQLVPTYSRHGAWSSRLVVNSGPGFGSRVPVPRCVPQASRDASPLHLRTQASPERAPPTHDVRAVSPVDRIEISLTSFELVSPQQPPQHQPYAQLAPPDSPPPPPPPPPPMTDESDAEAAADGSAGPGAGRGDAGDSGDGTPEVSPARSKSTKRVQLAVDVDAAAGASSSCPESSLGMNGQHGKESSGGGTEGGVGMVLGGPEERGNGSNPQGDGERKRRTLSARKKGQYGFGSGVPRKSWLDPELAKKNMTQEEKERQAARAMLLLHQQASMRERGGGVAAVALMTDVGMPGSAGSGAKGPPGLLLEQLGSSMSRQGSSTGLPPGAPNTACVARQSDGSSTAYALLWHHWWGGCRVSCCTREWCTGIHMSCAEMRRCTRGLAPWLLLNSCLYDPQRRFGHPRDVQPRRRQPPLLPTPRQRSRHLPCRPHQPHPRSFPRPSLRLVLPCRTWHCQH